MLRGRQIFVLHLLKITRKHLVSSSVVRVSVCFVGARFWCTRWSSSSGMSRPSQSFPCASAQSVEIPFQIFILEMKELLPWWDSPGLDHVCVRAHTHTLRPRPVSSSLKCPNTCLGFSFCYSLWERKAAVFSPSPLSSLPSCHHRPWRRAEGTFPGYSRCRRRWLCPAHRKWGGNAYFSVEHLHILLLLYFKENTWTSL